MSSGRAGAVSGPAFGFSLTRPPGWIFDRYLAEDAAVGVSNAARSGVITEDQARALGVARDNPKSEVVLYLLDPELTYYCEANVGRVENLDANARKSPRAWAETDITRIAGAGKALAEA